MYPHSGGPVNGVRVPFLLNFHSSSVVSSCVKPHVDGSLSVRWNVHSNGKLEIVFPFSNCTSVDTVVVEAPRARGVGTGRMQYQVHVHKTRSMNVKIT